MIVTLLSDFGNKDNAVAIAKGLVLKQNPELRLIDLSHEATPYNLLQCSYLLNSAYKNFPENTVHLSMFDIMHSSPADVLFTKIDDQIIVSADNGLFSFSFPNEDFQVYKYALTANNYYDWIGNAATLIKELHHHDFDFSKIGLSIVRPKVEITPLRPAIKENQIECQVIHVDRFGNVVLNVTQQDFEQLKGNKKFSIVLPRRSLITRISENYNDVTEGEKLCLFNSAGYLEIAIREGSAAQLLGLEMFKKDQLIYNVIPIEFV